jgi:hypothetical protein
LPTASVYSDTWTFKCVVNVFYYCKKKNIGDILNQLKVN